MARDEALLAPVRVIQQTNRAIASILKGDLKILKRLAAYVVASGGKRIRPLFLYYLGKSYGLDGQELFRLGALLEIVHAASLLHDDVVDEAHERRGKPTGALLFGNPQVILGGDHLLASGLEFLNTLGNASYMTVFTGAIRALAEAELLQLQQRFDLKTDLKTHERIVDGKTAVLFRSAGALVSIMRHGGAKTDFYRADTALLGEMFGRYFQHRDDYLDYFDSTRLQKKGLQDFQNGIVTRPLLYLLKAASRPDTATIRKAWLQAQAGNTITERGDILLLMQKYQIGEKCRAELSNAEEAILQRLAVLPEKHARETIRGEFQKILAVRAA